jgi:hypothetical protein
MPHTPTLKPSNARRVRRVAACPLGRRQQLHHNAAGATQYDTLQRSTTRCNTWVSTPLANAAAASPSFEVSVRGEDKSDALWLLDSPRGRRWRTAAPAPSGTAGCSACAHAMRSLDCVLQHVVPHTLQNSVLHALQHVVSHTLQPVVPHTCIATRCAAHVCCNMVYDVRCNPAHCACVGLGTADRECSALRARTALKGTRDRRLVRLTSERCTTCCNMA